MWPLILGVATLLGGTAAVHYLWKTWRSADTALSRSDDSVAELPDTPSLPSSEKSAQSETDDAVVFPHETSTTLFGFRMAKAFPGAQGIVVLENGEAADRLEMLLAAPLSGLDEGGHNRSPFWWFRGGSSSAIRSFERLSNNECLIGPMEVPLARIAAYRDVDPAREFVYVELLPSEPTGLYPVEGPGITDHVAEEYGILGGHLITLSERMDGYAMIDDESVSTSGVPPRVRYLTPFNVVITGKSSPINSPKFDRVSKVLMPQILVGESDVEDLVELVRALPSRSMKFDEIW